MSEDIQCYEVKLKNNPTMCKTSCVRPHSQCKGLMARHSQQSFLVSTEQWANIEPHSLTEFAGQLQHLEVGVP